MATMFRKGCWNRGAICAATAMFAACSEPTSVAPEAATPDVAEAPGAGRDGGMLELERGDFRLLFPTAMNERGLVVGWASGDGPWRAVAWLDGKLSVLPALGPGLSRAADVNRRGVIVGSSTDALGRVRAVRWIDGRVEDLGVLPGGGEAAALGINDRGQIVGVSESAGELKGFLWDRGTMLPLEPGGGGTFAYAEAINNRGVVVGWAAGGVLTQGAMVWRDGVVEPLPTLAYESAALGINARGEIIGGSFPVYQTAARAVRWVDGLIEDLATPEGVRFTAANDINDRGEITGWGDGTGVVVWDDGRYRQVYPVGVGRAIDNRGNIAVSGDGVLGVLRRGGRGGEPAGPGTPGPGLSAPGTVGPPAAAGEVGRQGEGPGASGLCRRVPIMTPGLRATLELAGCVD